MIPDLTHITPRDWLLGGLLAAVEVAAWWSLWRAGRQLRGTLLRAPWAWACAALAAVTLVELALRLPSWQDAPLRVHARYLAAIVTLAPIVAVLGAKRPQDRAWQWIVLSLWGILALPAARAALLAQGRGLQLHASWQWFLLAFILAGPANYLPTRYWLTSLLVAAGQALLLADHLPLPALVDPAWRQALAVGLLCLAPICAALWPRGAPAAGPLDRVWLDFRNAFGAWWSLRVRERFNAAAEQSGWPARLTWFGLASTTGASPDARAGQATEAVQISLRGLLRRFVSEAWIVQRLAPSERRSAGAEHCDPR